ncbi:unnamed protein product [Tetraodon nigroviridis]|uniref:(spotted green pufferfish) hypothetical protein n=1 Tax=Tetraodon nigroviridis TaxID=99883 RepID=Q4RFZ6_TETNG|nr:unnamed protein product [Tetraodon nigroviridis]
MSGRGKGGKGLGKGGAKRHPQGPPRQHPGHHQTRHPPPGSARRREAHLRPDLRGDPRGAEGVPGERDPRRRHLHGARQEEDGDGHGRGVRPEEAGPHPVRLRRLERPRRQPHNGSFQSHTPPRRAGVLSRDLGKLERGGCDGGQRSTSP